MRGISARCSGARAELAAQRCEAFVARSAEFALQVLAHGPSYSAATAPLRPLADAAQTRGSPGPQPAHAFAATGVRQAGPGALEHHAWSAGLTMEVQDLLHDLLRRAEIDAAIAHELVGQPLLQRASCSAGSVSPGSR